ncbi:30S ribosomal protein S9 [Patescibacteria group bacterium]|nr:30S ribosomal protein S9 [Patescibacteria group bacterium]
MPTTKKATKTKKTAAASSKKSSSASKAKKASATATKKKSTSKPSSVKKKKSTSKPSSVKKKKASSAAAKKSVNDIWATGKRKTAIARVKFSPEGKGDILINKLPLVDCHLAKDLRKIVKEPLVLVEREKFFSWMIDVRGGGTKGQAEAIRLGIARALVAFNPEWRKELKAAGFLRRDPRKKERKKPGLKRARRAPQWSKR